jgi:chemotaxis signal transduction protein
MELIDPRQSKQTGIGKVKEKVIMLLDTDKILSSHEIHAISKLAE